MLILKGEKKVKIVYCNCKRECHKGKFIIRKLYI